MIETFAVAPAGIDAVRAVGTLSRADDDAVVVPMLEAAERRDAACATSASSTRSSTASLRTGRGPT